MAATILADQQGAYELKLTAGTALTVTVHSPYARTRTPLTVTHHAGTAPVYVREGSAVVVADPKARMIPPFTFQTIDTTTDPLTITVISAADATVSVSRS